MSQMTREQFIQQVIAHVKSRFPLVKIGRAQQSFSVRVNGNLASLENLYRLTVLRPADLQRHVERWIVELIRASEGTPDQDAEFEEVKQRIMPMVLPRTNSGFHTGTMITQAFLEDLLIAYAVDSDRTMAYIPQLHYERWGITLDQLHETALQNLMARSEAISAHAAHDEQGRVSLILFQTMDGYDASRILLPTLHERLREHLGSPFAAGIPNRDILLCFRNDEATVAGLRTQIADDYRQMPHQVTDRLLLVTPDGIAMRD